jgi:hypothetical protein
MFPNVHPMSRDFTWDYAFCKGESDEPNPPVFNRSQCGYIVPPKWYDCKGCTEAKPWEGGECDPLLALKVAVDGGPDCPFIQVQPDDTGFYVVDMNVTTDTLTGQGKLFVDYTYKTTVNYLTYSAEDFTASLAVDMGRIMFCTNAPQVLANYLYRYYITTWPEYAADTIQLFKYTRPRNTANPPLFPDTVVGCEKPLRLDSVKFHLRPSVAPTPTPTPSVSSTPTASRTPTPSNTPSSSRSATPTPTQTPSRSKFSGLSRLTHTHLKLIQFSQSPPPPYQTSLVTVPSTAATTTATAATNCKAIFR